MNTSAESTTTPAPEASRVVLVDRSITRRITCHTIATPTSTTSNRERRVRLARASSDSALL